MQLVANLTGAESSKKPSFDEILMYGGGDDPLEGDWDDQEDEDFDDILEDKEDLHEIQVDDDRGEPDPEDDDHLPDDDLQ
jgi:hypothetical protein